MTDAMGITKLSVLTLTLQSFQSFLIGAKIIHVKYNSVQSISDNSRCKNLRNRNEWVDSVSIEIYEG